MRHSAGGRVVSRAAGAAGTFVDESMRKRAVIAWDSEDGCIA